MKETIAAKVRILFVIVIVAEQKEYAAKLCVVLLYSGYPRGICRALTEICTLAVRLGAAYVDAIEYVFFTGSPSSTM